jgi:hypothetical protein
MVRSCLERMTGLKTITKISLLLYGLVCLLFGVMIVFLLDAFVTPMTGWTNPLHPRMFGGVLFVIAVFDFLILFKKDWEWEQVKLAFLVLYSLILVTIIMELSVTAVYLASFSAAAVSEIIFENILMSVLFLLGVFSYLKQRA